MVFSKGDCKIMYLWKNNPIQQNIAWGNEIEISFSKVPEASGEHQAEHEPGM